MIPRKTELLLILTVFILFVFLVSFGLSKDFFLDEVVYVKIATAIVQKSYPVYYDDEIMPSRYGLVHPPLFVSLLAISFKAFGVGEVSARIVPVMFRIFTIAVIYVICKIFVKPPEKGTKVALLSIFLFALMRINIQNALQIDIDGSVLTFFTTFFLLTILSWYYNRTFKWALASVVVLFFSFFTKETTIICVLAFLIFLMLTKNIKRYARGFLAITLAGFTLFLFSFATYCLIFMPNPTKAFLLPIFANAQLGSESHAGYFGNMLLTIGRLAWYLSYPFIILGLLSLWSVVRSSNSKPYSLLMLLWVLLFGITFTFIFPRCLPRYFAPGLPPLIMLASEYIVDKIGSLKRLTTFLYVALFFGMFTYFFLLGVSDISYFVRVIRGVFTDKNIIFSLIPCFLPLTIWCWVKLSPSQAFHNSKTARNRTCILIIVVLVISYNVYFNYVNLSNPYLLYPGLVGIKDAGIYINQHTELTDLIIAPKDVAYYAQRRFYEYSWYGISISQEQVHYMIEHRVIRCFAHIGLPNEDLQTILAIAGYNLTIIGNVYIYILT